MCSFWAQLIPPATMALLPVISRDARRNATFLFDGTSRVEFERIVREVEERKFNYLNRSTQESELLRRVSSLDPLRYRADDWHPCTFTMYDWDQYAHSGEEWLSRPFYMRPPGLRRNEGYKMCLGVYANGYERTRGTHMSVLVHQMCGEFDSNLPWPFHGSLTVRILDQLFDHHIEKSLEFDAKCRISARSGLNRGWGWPKFARLISYRAGGGRGRDPLYIDDDAMRFEILDARVG